MGFWRKYKKLRKSPAAFFSDSPNVWARSFGQYLTQRQRLNCMKAGELASDTLVSVIMTSYNTGALAVKAAKSILGQKHSKIELIIVDDHSHDDTVEQLHRLAKYDPRIRLFKSVKNMGTYWCKNFGLQQARGDFVAFQDSDDISAPQRIRFQLGSFYLKPDQVACTIQWERIDSEGTIVPIDGRHARMAAISLMIRRQEVLKTIGYFDSVRIAADTEYLGRLSTYFGRGKLVHYPQILYQGLLRDQSLTRSEAGGFDWQETAQGYFRTTTGDRLVYLDAAKNWHEQVQKDRTALFIPFPQRERSFEAPCGLVVHTKDEPKSYITEVTH